MKLKICSSLLITFIFTSLIYGQNTIKNNLINNWDSSFKIFSAGDTIVSTNEKLILNVDGSLSIIDQRMNIPGTWKFLDDTHQLELTITLGDQSETIALEIDKSTADELILTQKKGDRFKTTGYTRSNPKNKLINNWGSSFKIFTAGDTIANTNEKLILKKDGRMSLIDQQMNIPGTWKYLDDTHQLELTITLGDRSETIALEIDKSTDDELVLTQIKGDRSKTTGYKVQEE